MSSSSLNPASLAAFTASLSSAPQDEISKAKSLYIRNAIVDFRMMVRGYWLISLFFGIPWVVITVLGLILYNPGILIASLCGFVIFLPIFASFFISYQGNRQKIVNALEIWKRDLKEDPSLLYQELDSPSCFGAYFKKVGTFFQSLLKPVQ